MGILFDLSTLGLTEGTYTITVKAIGSIILDSDESNSVEYTTSNPDVSDVLVEIEENEDGSITYHITTQNYQISEDDDGLIYTIGGEQ